MTELHIRTVLAVLGVLSVAYSNVSAAGARLLSCDWLHMCTRTHTLA